jgi:CD36 family
MPFSD